MHSTTIFINFEIYYIPSLLYSLSWNIMREKTKKYVTHVKKEIIDITSP